MQEGSQRASAGCASVHGHSMAPFFIGASKDVMCIVAEEGRIRYGKHIFFPPLQPVHVEWC